MKHRRIIYIFMTDVLKLKLNEKMRDDFDIPDHIRSCKERLNEVICTMKRLHFSFLERPECFIIQRWALMQNIQYRNTTTALIRQTH